MNIVADNSASQNSNSMGYVVLIEQRKEQTERLILLHNLAVKQLQTMEALSVKGLPKLLVNKKEK